MKKILHVFVICCLISSMTTLINSLNAQSCVTALQPTITSVIDDTGAFGAPVVTVTWDPACGARAGDGCEAGDGNSLFWYVGLYGHNAPAPNGLAMECGSGFVEGGNCGFEGLIVTNGGDYGGLCLDPKGSTCISGEFSQMRPPGNGDLHSWHTFGDDGTGFLGICDAGGGSISFPVCPGQCYNAVVWELIIDQPTGTGPGAPGAAPGNTLPFAGFDDNLACGNIVLIDESPASAIMQVCVAGVNELIENPILTIMSDLGICAPTAATTFEGTFQSQPMDEGDPTLADPCQASDVDVLIDVDFATGAVDQVIGGTGNGGDAGDLTVTFTPGAGNSGNSELTLGAHVVEVNCRENIGLLLSVPTGCGGITDQNQFGLPPCSFADGSLASTDAKVYLTVNGTPIPGQPDPNAYPACFAETMGVGTCTTNAGVPGTYPANWTAQFGNFISSDDGGATSCITNVVGNPFEGIGANPFGFDGVTSMDFGDGVLRDVSTLCSIFEDPCDGSKSATCIKFISDAAPMSASVAACDETCPGSADGKIYVYDIVGGSDDPNGDGLYTDGNMGAYVLDIVAGPATGQIFTYLGGTTWEATGLAPGVYAIDIYDSLAPTDTFDDETDNGTAACGAACPIQVIVEILPGPLVTCVAENLVTGDCDVAGSATLAIDKESQASNGDVTIMSAVFPGQSLDADGAVGTSCVNPFSEPVSGLYTNCSSDIISGATVKNICITIDNAVADGAVSAGAEAWQIALVSPSGTQQNLMSGGCFGGPGPCPFGGPNFDGTVCFQDGAPPYSDVSPGTYAPDNPFSVHGGANANGNWTVVIFNADCSFGDPVTTIDGLSFEITYADQICTLEEDIAAFCATAGPDEGDMAGAITSADQTITWTSDAAGGEAAAEPFTYATFTGGGEEGISFDMAAASDANGPGVTICYSMEAYVPGNNFSTANDFMDMTGMATTCYQGACCPVTCAPICFTTIACFNCVDSDPPVLTGEALCEGDNPNGLTAACDPCADIVGFSGSSMTTWYSDAAATTMVATGASYVPTDTAPGTYTYYAVCSCTYNDPDASVCESTIEMVDFVINEVPVVSLATPVLGCNDVVEDLNLSPMPPPTDPSGTGVYSGSGAAFVDASGTMIVSNYQMVMSQGVPYSLTYTFTTPDGCEDETTIQLLFDKNCAADAGRFDEDE